MIKKFAFVSLFFLGAIAGPLMARSEITRDAGDRFEIQLNDPTCSGIRMLQVTDLHLGKKGFWKQDLTTFRRIKKLVEMYDPHLIAVTGDLFTGEKYFGSLLAAFAVQFFDGLERPWLYVFGNHDPAGGFGRDQIYKVFSESRWGVLGFHPVPGDTTRKYDYVVSLKTGERHVPSWNIYAFDSGAEPGFKSIKTDQIRWYRNISELINPAKTSRAISIFHIPLKQYQDLWDDSTLAKMGASKEKVSFEEDDGSVYDAFVKKGEIEAAFCGHDHYNNYWGKYHGGIILAYGYISGEATKWAWPTGGKLITLPLNGGEIGIENVVPDMTKQKSSAPIATDSAENKRLSAEILSNPDLPFVLQKAKAILKSGLNAGSGYGEVWIRDLNTFIELALEVRNPREIRQALLNFFHFQGADGNIIDGYIAAEKAKVPYKFIKSATQPQFLGHKNTVETDQESSLVQAIFKYVRATGDRSFLAENLNGKSVRQRMSDALYFLLKQRFSKKYGLVWGATTVDWGDVQPEHRWGVEMDENSHRAIDVYDNAMFIIAVKNYVSLLAKDAPERAEWEAVANEIRSNVRKHLWDEKLHKFLPHIYLEGSPFPGYFDEQRIYYHGGTAVAIEAGILSGTEILAVLNDMVNNRRFAGAASIGLTIFPAYPEGFFKNKQMRPWSYQNGGDWTWFGGRMIQQLVANGFVEQAYRECLPMVKRVRKNGGFFEWYTRDNKPSGSGAFRGSAGVLEKAVKMLLEWAERNR